MLKPTHVLGFRSFDLTVPSFELLVDECPISESFDSPYAAMPYRLVRDDLPGWPRTCQDNGNDIRLIAVCECGVHGCGNVRARVSRLANEVVFSEFAGDVEDAPHELRVTRENYDNVIAQLVRVSRDWETPSGMEIIECERFHGMRDKVLAPFLAHSARVIEIACECGH